MSETEFSLEALGRMVDAQFGKPAWDNIQKDFVAALGEVSDERIRDIALAAFTQGVVNTTNPGSHFNKNWLGRVDEPSEP